MTALMHRGLTKALKKGGDAREKLIGREIWKEEKEES